MIIANQTSTRDVVIQHGADLGIAFDGDFDRCFFLTKQGRLSMAVSGRHACSSLFAEAWRGRCVDCL